MLPNALVHEVAARVRTSTITTRASRRATTSAHRHYHEVYRFPVYSDYGVEYYPYAYCEGNFFGRGTFRNGRAVFDIHIGF